MSFTRGLGIGCGVALGLTLGVCLTGVLLSRQWLVALVRPVAGEAVAPVTTRNPDEKPSEPPAAAAPAPVQKPKPVAKSRRPTAKPVFTQQPVATTAPVATLQSDKRADFLDIGERAVFDLLKSQVLEQAGDGILAIEDIPPQTAKKLLGVSLKGLNTHGHPYIPGETGIVAPYTLTTIQVDDTSILFHTNNEPEQILYMTGVDVGILDSGNEFTLPVDWVVFVGKPMSYQTAFGTRRATRLFHVNMERPTQLIRDMLEEAAEETPAEMASRLEAEKEAARVTATKDTEKREATAMKDLQAGKAFKGAARTRWLQRIVKQYPFTQAAVDAQAELDK